MLITTSKSKFYLSIVLLFLSSLVYGGNERYSNQLSGQGVQVNATYEVYDDHYSELLLPSWPTLFTNHNVKNTVRLSIRKDAVQTQNYSGTVHTVQVKIDYQVWGTSGTYTTQQVTKNLSLDYSTTETNTINDQTTFSFSGAHYVKVTVMNINGLDPEDLQLESIIDVDRYYAFNPASSVSSSMSFDNSAKRFNLRWDVIPGAELYEVEYVYVNNYSLTPGYPTLATGLSVNFYLNSTRIETTSNSYSLPAIFDQGYFVFRVRAIGKSGTNFQNRIEGVWNTNESDLISNIPTNNKYLITSEYDIQMNWGHQVAFAENGKRVEGVGYVDGLGRVRQQVGYNSETEQVIVSNVYYDELGRAVVSDLPTPLSNTYLHHFPDFNRANIIGTPSYNATNFETGSVATCNLNAVGFSNNFGAGLYYSSNNPNKEGANALIPDGNNYPFSRISYLNDYTGRVDRVSAMGPDLKMGSGKETRMIYQSPLQAELDALFGVDAGIQSHYQKITTVDANGQAYTKYLDMAGRVVATYLEGVSPDNVSSLENNTPENKTFHFLVPGGTQNSNPTATPPSAQLLVTKYFPDAGNYTINYGFTPAQYTAACLNTTICLDCVYDLKLKVSDECAQTVYENTITINGGEFNLLCNSVTPQNITAEIPLAEGKTYTFSKTLSVNQASIDGYWCLYLENNTCIPTLASNFNALYTAEAFESCNELADLEDLTPSGPCGEYKALMLEDFYPGGQYASYTQSGNTYTSTNPWSIFTTTGSAFTSGHRWNNPPSPYLDELGNNVTAQVTQSMGYFISHFRNEWAELFLTDHPEYCRLQICEQNSASNTYDENFAAVDEYSTAISNGYLLTFDRKDLGPRVFSDMCVALVNDINNISNTAIPIDPFFAAGGQGASEFANFAADINDYITLVGPTGSSWQGLSVHLSLWQYALYIANNCDETVNPTVCIGNCPPCNNFDFFWITYRDLYLELKASYVYKVQSALAQSNCPMSACVGVQSTNCSSNNGLLNDFISVFGNGISFDAFTNTGIPAMTNGINNMNAAGCAASCEEYADEWLTKLAGCNIAQLDATKRASLRVDLMNLCMSGCNSDIQMPVSTSPNGNRINTILADPNYLGPNFESVICTDLLISEPSPYQSLEEQAALITSPLDICGCEYFMSARTEFQTAQSNNELPTGVTNIEDWLIATRGYDIDDVDRFLCICDQSFTNGEWNANAATELAQSNLTIDQQINCTDNNCVACTDVVSVLPDLLDEINTPSYEAFTLVPNFAVILQNYYNNLFGFDLAASDYESFIAKCGATSQDPYCEENPLLSEWASQMTLIAMRGQLTGTMANYNLETQNIVYTHGQLKNNGFGANLSSSIEETILTLNYVGTTSCVVNMTLPQGADFTFEDIVSFENIIQLSGDCGEQTHFGVEVDYYACGVRKTAMLSVTSDCLIGFTCTCDPKDLTLCYDPFEPTSSTCYEPRLSQLIYTATQNYETAVADAYQDFKQTYNTSCAAAFTTEHESLYGAFSMYQYTLFYYDQAGNLSHTVAPKGVHELAEGYLTAVQTARNAVVNSSSYPTVINGQTKPIHDFVTAYVYNSYNQLVSTTNPDQVGATNYWYDRYGRMAASQNPVQAIANDYAYVLYDPQGRPLEVGVVNKPSAPSETILKAGDLGASFQNWVTSGTTRREVTRTKYDKSLSNTIAGKFATGTQDNLRLRVASVLHYLSVNGSTDLTTAYESATHYSYDIHGNVKEELQDVPMVAAVKQDIKSTAYTYELISGNVKKVSYQKNQLDQMEHTYEYDKLNRLTDVYTTTDQVHKEHQAKYRYYDYGPLARVEIGDQKVQNMDYAYTINGWIKGMNSSVLNGNYDAGKDGNFGYLATNNQIHIESAPDVVAYTLGYFDGDYTPIGSSSNFETAYSGSTFGNGSPNLYNGNIRNLVTSIAGFETMGSAYTYDQLNRLKDMHTYKKTGGFATNTWSGGNLSSEYFNSYNYDKNGNITHLRRDGQSAALPMDDIDYKYQDPNTAGASNRLSYVTDAVGASATYSDIDNQAANNYTYDKLGQLLSDAAEGIQNIVWRTSDKKIQSIVRNDPNSPELDFFYNPFGQRIIKRKKPRVAGVVQSASTWVYTYYAYDANGQVMGIYELNPTGTGIADLKELPIYGASRLGMIDRVVNLYNNGDLTTLPSDVLQHTAGNMRYEITNYLGNVNAVISDRKVPETGYHKYVYNTGTEGWAGTQTTLTYAGGQLKAVTSGAPNYISKVESTVIGQRYLVRVKTDKGTTTGLQIDINGTITNLANLQRTTLSFVATSTSTTIKITPVNTNSFTYTYYVDEVEIATDHLYKAVVFMKADYYPFGMEMPGRTWQSDAYRYGYNGMEKDNEVKGNGNSYSTEFRQYDPRLGRWLSLDPLKRMFPSSSPYSYAENCPIAGYDNNGKYTIFVNGYIYGKESGTADDIKPGREYWSSSRNKNEFIDAAHDYFGDGNHKFVNGTGFDIFSLAGQRRVMGYVKGKVIAKEILEAIKNGVEVKELNIVSHSMGAAYAEGMIEALAENPTLLGLLNKGEIVHFSACDGDNIEIGKNVAHLKRTQLNYTHDNTLLYADHWATINFDFANPNSGSAGYQIPGVTRFIMVNADLHSLHPHYTMDKIQKYGQWDFHFDTKTYQKPWDFIKQYNNEKRINHDQPYRYDSKTGPVDSEIEKVEGELNELGRA